MKKTITKGLLHSNLSKSNLKKTITTSLLLFSAFGINAHSNASNNKISINYSSIELEFDKAEAKNNIEANLAKEKKISGKVTDASGQPIAGVTVKNINTAMNVLTDFDGNFSIMADKGNILEFSYIGMKTKKYSTTDETQIKIIMEDEVSSLGEVIVVGFGAQKRSNVSGSVTSVKMNEVLGDRPIIGTASAIQGALPGLQVVSGSGRPGQGFDVQIRGFQSINGGSPLVLVNNVPMSMDNINPKDIESVTVLKDAAATSIYGARAAFGVILITTKTGKKNQEIQIDYSTSSSFDYATNLPEKASVYDFVNALNTWGTTGFWTNQDIPTWKGALDAYKLNPANYPDGSTVINNVTYPLTGNDEAGKDFYSDLGTTTIHNLSISGGSEKSDFRMSAGYTKQDGIIVTDNDSFKRFTLNTDYRAYLSDKLTFDMNVNYLNSLTKDPIGDYYRYITFAAYAPTGFQTQPDGSLIPYDTPGNMERFRVAPKTQRDNLRFFSKMEYKPFKSLSVIGEYTYGYSTSNFKSVNNQATFIDALRYTPLLGDPTKTSVNLSNGQTRYNATNLYAKFKQKFESHNFELLTGFNNEMSKSTSLEGGVTSLIDPSLPSIDLATGTEYANDSFNDWSVMGFFGRFGYNYKEKYFLEVNGRRDGSSRFPKEQRWGFFPSASAAWNITNESFMENLTSVSLLKLRASLGEIGNQDIRKSDGVTAEYYGFFEGLSGVQAGWIDPSTGIKYTSLSTPALVRNNFTWETVRTLNYGIDVGFFNNRLTGSFDLFKRQTLDMLGPGASLPSILGATPPLQNAADLEVNGWELEMKWRGKINNFSYYAGFNLSDSQAEITRYNNTSGLLGNYYVGQKLGEIYGYETDGYYNNNDFVSGTLDSNLQNGTLNPGVVKVQGVNPNPGDIKYKDLNGDGIINSGNNTLYTQYDAITGEMIPNTGLGDRKVIGNNTRRYQYGINAGASYKGFDLSVFVQGVGKRDVWLSNEVVFPYPGEFSIIYAHQLDYWTPENTDAYYPRNYARGGGNYGYNLRTQTKYLADGSYVRLKNITLGYSLPKAILKRSPIQNVKLYFSGENLFTYDHLPDGINTELSNLGNGGNYPFLKQYSFGINVSF
ncbi:SusC/RagA family TonB-linked outer membrane protein [Flavobacterium sp. W1B]|uniref:SusC/RagA family TonB-linked outer membrane protein n=1 Tax=Flavobacterium sp. W1B TaxID=3394146 RepID=UPI0039BCF15B